MVLTVGSRTIEYPDKRFHNLPKDTERAVVIPLVWNEVVKYDPTEVLEVGAVLHRYIHIDHDVLDLFEKGSGIINSDVRTYVPTKRYKLIVSITTLEHVGDETDGNDRDEFGIFNAVVNMKRMLDDGGRIFFTVPIGQNKMMDKQFADGLVSYTNIWYIKKMNKENQWQEVDWEDVKDTILYYPFVGSNAEIVCEILK